MNPQRTYDMLLQLYPQDYRDRFASEMLTAFEQAVKEQPRQGVLLREFIDLFVGAGAEWFAKLTTDSATRGRCLPDLRMMRPPGVPREIWFDARRGSEAQED
jgi:hypothetical protein